MHTDLNNNYIVKEECRQCNLSAFGDKQRGYGQYKFNKSKAK